MNSQLVDTRFRTGKGNIELKRKLSEKYTGGQREYAEIKIKIKRPKRVCIRKYIHCGGHSEHRPNFKLYQKCPVNVIEKNDSLWL